MVFGAPEGYVDPAPHVTPVVLLLLVRPGNKSDSAGPIHEKGTGL